MGRTGDTKKQIIDLLETKRGTLTEISDRLDLAPSTVSQHLKELLNSGQIKLADDRPRKWKYYEINRGPVTSPYQQGFQMKSLIIPIGGIILIALVISGIYFAAGKSTVAVAQQVYVAPGSQVPTGSTVFSVSDSPQFYNLSALFVTVTNASVRSDSGKWYKIPLQEHTFNLVGLDNISKILSGVNLTAGGYDAVELYVSNVSAIVNGTSMPVYLPSGKLLAVGRFNISTNATNWVNIDFDLARSLHITGNGTLVMMPVLLISRRTGNGIALNVSSIIITRGPPVMHEAFEFGMDMNGSMKGNYTIPQNISLRLLRGRPVMTENGMPIFIMRSDYRFIIGTDAREFIGENAINDTTIRPLAARMVNIQRENNTTWLVRLPPGLVRGNMTGYADCRFMNGGVSCSGANTIVSNSIMPNGRLVIVGGSCAGLRPGEC